MSTEYHVTDGVAVILLANPPVNGLGYSTRVGIVESIDRAVKDPEVKGIVLSGSGKAFSGGADMREFNNPKARRDPGLNTVLAAIEDCPKPVVAAIHTVAMGGGLELALACHFRVAVPGAQIALSEVRMGLLPGAGGTQRLPRIIGLERATNMIVTGASVKSESLKDSGLFDQFFDGDLLCNAADFAREVASRPGPYPRIRDRRVEHPNPEAFLEFVRTSLVAKQPQYPAPQHALQAVRAAVFEKFDDGLAQERRSFLELMEGSVSKSLRHAFFAERAAQKIDNLPEGTTLRTIDKVAVLGGGTMGTGIAMCFLNAGIPVKLSETNDELAAKAVATIRRNYEATVKKGKLSQEAAEKRMGLLQPVVGLKSIGDTDLVVEAVFEDMELKKTVFRELDAVMKKGAILASNTSTLDLDAIADVVSRPADVVGLHFFSPANVMRLLEVVRGAKTAPDVLATSMQIAKRIGKVAVVSGVCDGFIGNRMIAKYGQQAQLLVQQGAYPEEIDRAVEKFGMAMGPFRMSDLAGNDIGWAIRKRRYAEDPSAPRSEVADRLCEAGRFGQKTGAGWYDYKAGERKPIPAQAVKELLEAYWAEKGVSRRKYSQDEIVQRLIFALVDEGARILEEGIAARASDIDLVYLNGYGFPTWRGGPMFYADTVGLFSVARAMEQAGQVPAALVQNLVAEGGSFNS
ncbi:Trifunctonal enoyl-CoA hydratase [Cupriavidus taiwanensis]|uniref:Trifunctonal enoyl-CoA hydratase n=1 Tax=Cupriavidus taiwanensis TaxID=164546 RepID=A0A375EA55_9BURK|nr:3-hydroxyacyl-CoA dehydrogenase NAD-binding domain-containing protein [Cupriavidus taiwanensis]SOZ68551.1 Trifunctonal enoyl-CoA hydratase [Cupriavidus taiwanensis]SOZ69707.1 Trifunctonal enoyl-CoA hydratase [Cupriavidus taiwanensis]SOZ72917.1 Trifunctonal enoyl-CoA hydratase [Cupriavidus taiwanensis]SPA09775.1 Trifunctonal enoyl-CoA hydratase [Cupriavidus taiwanensis]SPA23834.1 Trifunctonal enoyl-CoA hydratase [Cupriavidus taiwanensis]